MSEQQEDHPVNEEGLKIVGKPEDVSRFRIGDLVQVHLEMKDRVFVQYPHEERGVVVALDHKDDEYFYHMPVVQFPKELRMFNPDHIIVVQRDDGTQPEKERLEEAQKKTEAEKKRAEEEGDDS